MLRERGKVVAQLVDDRPLDASLIHQIGTELDAACRHAHGRGKRIVLDLGRVDVLGTALVLKLMAAERLASLLSLDLRLANLTPSVRKVLSITGLASRFRIE